VWGAGCEACESLLAVSSLVWVFWRGWLRCRRLGRVMCRALRAACLVRSGGGPFPLTVDLSSGGYVEAARFWIRPGVEVRGTTQTISSGQQGLILAGPRIAHLIQGGNVYAAALFGPSQQPNGTGTKEISGVTSQVDVGVERDLGPYVRWRVIELNAGFFSGASGLQTFAVSTGLVLHFH
jgi:hypothetical protein